MSVTIFPFPVLAETPATGRFHPPRMQSQLLEEAAKIIPDQQKLINVVSKRVRQLSQGHRPLVEVLPRMVYSDIALKELIDGKLTFREAGTGDDANALDALAK
jgi:DNA-directed RNA polymerase subunit omega